MALSDLSIRRPVIAVTVHLDGGPPEMHVSTVLTRFLIACVNLVLSQFEKSRLLMEERLEEDAAATLILTGSMHVPNRAAGLS